MHVYLCVCVPLFARMHTQIHTHERLGGSKRKQEAQSGLAPRSTTRGAARRRGHARGAEADRDGGVLTYRYRS